MGLFSLHRHTVPKRLGNLFMFSQLLGRRNRICIQLFGIEVITRFRDLLDCILRHGDIWSSSLGYRFRHLLPLKLHRTL